MTKGPLNGVRVIEIEGIGPGPFCGMHLADLGAEVIVIERPAGATGFDMGDGFLRRGKRSVVLDLKKPEHVAAALKLIETADALIEGMRPGVMERLGLGPAECHAVNPRLVYGRVTGWGQDGPLARAAGHDLNYVALSGAAWYASPAGQPPVPPPTLVGDIGGGALYLTIGVLAGVLNARATGRGDVIDAAMVDGSAHMTNLLLFLTAMGGMSETRGQGLLDGSHWYDSYPCADGLFISVGPLEPKFYADFLKLMGLDADPDFAAQYDKRRWPAQKARLAEIFASRERAHWCALLEGSDACFAPVLSPREAADHPHMRARDSYITVDGALQARAAPRFAAYGPTTPGSVPVRGADTADIFRGLGLSLD